MPTASPEPTATSSPLAAPTADEGSALPLWLWAVLGLVLLGLVVAWVASRRGKGERQQAAQAEGQLAWVRSQVDDALVRWRGEQLALSTDARDTDSELARRWALVDQRTTAATDTLLTLETATSTDAVRESSRLLREATESYRTSLDTLALALSTGDGARTAQAQQGFAADTALLDQARQRFRQASGL